MGFVAGAALATDLLLPLFATAETNCCPWFDIRFDEICCRPQWELFGHAIAFNHQNDTRRDALFAFIRD